MYLCVCVCIYIQVISLFDFVSFKFFSDYLRKKILRAPYQFGLSNILIYNLYLWVWQECQYHDSNGLIEFLSHSKMMSFWIGKNRKNINYIFLKKEKERKKEDTVLSFSSSNKPQLPQAWYPPCKPPPQPSPPTYLALTYFQYFIYKKNGPCSKKSPEIHRTLCTKLWFRCFY